MKSKDLLATHAQTGARFGFPPRPLGALLKVALLLLAPSLARSAPALSDPEFISSMYAQHCASCHGLTGRGDGVASNQLFPRPRDFVESPLRFAPGGGAEEDLIRAAERTILEGIPKSSMPGFRGVLEDSVILGLARYVVGLRKAADAGSSTESPALGDRPSVTPELLARGAQLYESLGCAACHGATGRGDGPSSSTLIDSIGRPLRPPDMTTGRFKSGQSAEDLCRVLLRGIPGTPMAAFEASLVTVNPDGTRDASAAWALVAHLQSLQAKDSLAGIVSGAEFSLREFPDAEMALNPAHDGWRDVPSTEIEIKPLWQRGEDLHSLSVRALKTAGRIAMALEWRDPSMDVGRDHGVFPDGCAVMFSLGNEVAALPMGASLPGRPPSAPVNIWHWQADRQFRASAPEASLAREPSATGSRVFLLASGAQAAPEPAGSPPGAPPELPSFRAAEEAGNVPSLPILKGHAVLESNAQGLGTLTPQPASNQDVLGTAVWVDGRWRVVMVRDLASNEEGDIALDRTARIPVAFAVWDGSKGDRDGMKLISAWHWLVVEGPAEPPSPSDSNLPSAPSNPDAAEVNR